ncbi:class I SAM-dependent methyltransferase [Paenibacillus flagellatus]|uniref:Class I SAM-dependent methyltransferase n=1 Tax=Paenibacillus flagellatus TaxID=2211139 RepID=A0A2V5JZB7_9BACL|nr:class I SAM-dependent methyltransferase [Paenibacillus flagellatus]PYI52081.1 class I SAM-dependent methyltransferase [Paenibacillus flagellatus]
MQHYYSRRAREYESVYDRDDPVRLKELADLEQDMRDALRGRSVLEIACGTGYWTERAARSADRITATDLTPEALEIAMTKPLPPGKVRFRQADAYEPALIPGTFDAGLANFWLSHVPKLRLPEFLQRLHDRLGSGAVVFMADNMYVDGVGGELVRRTGEQDTYKLRTLSDGTRFEVLKNYYTADELIGLFTPYASELRVQAATCFWWATYRIA